MLPTREPKQAAKLLPTREPVPSSLSVGFTVHRAWYEAMSRLSGIPAEKHYRFHNPFLGGLTTDERRRLKESAASGKVTQVEIISALREKSI